MQSKAEPRAYADDHGVYGLPGDLSPWDIRFDPGDRVHLDAAGQGAARFRAWAEPELTDGMVVVRAGGSVSGYPMVQAARTKRFGFWEVVAGPFPDGSEFSLALRAPGGKGIYLTPSGITSAVERIDRWPLSIPEPLTVPDWAKGALIYQIFPDRFSRSASGDTQVDLDPWGSTPRPRSFQGGNLGGITSRLDYLSDLGVDVLYLNPIFTSPSNHRYDTIDYYNVDPMLGGNAALDKLITEAHARSMRVILDTSLNHVHPAFFAFADVMEHGPDSHYWDWFVVEEWPLILRYRPEAKEVKRRVDWVRHWGDELGLPVVELDDAGPAIEPSYEAWYGVPTMPRVNLANPEARRYMLDVAAHWPREHGVDGWRMDVVRYVDPDFWDDFRSVVKKANPEAFLLCEVMGDAREWLGGNRFDATMNYTFRDLCRRFFANEEIDGAAFIDGAARLWAQYAWDVTLANQNLLSSHDTARFLTECSGELWRMKLAVVFQMTYPGSPGLYYGDEVGMEGGEEPVSRGALVWQNGHEEHELHAAIRELAALRRCEPALMRGEWRPLEADAGLVQFERQLGDRTITVLINRSNSGVSVDGLAVSTILWGEGEIREQGVLVAPRSAMVAA